MSEGQLISHFKNSAIVARKLILSHFIDVKSISEISGFNLKRMKIIARWRCSTRISKLNLKTIISPLLTRPQGCQWCQKIWKAKLKTTLVSWTLRFSTNWMKLKKRLETEFLGQFLFNFDSFFYSFFSFGWILELQLTRVNFGLIAQIFWNPWQPWGPVNNGVKQILVI